MLMTDPTDSTENAEPTLPTDMNEPTLPTDSIDPLEQIARNDSSDRHDHFELLIGTACRLGVRVRHEQ